MNSRSAVLLSSWGAPGLAEIIESLRERRVSIGAIVLAGEFNPRDMAIVEERTRGYYRPRTVFDISIPELPFHFVESHNSGECRDLLRSLRPTVLVNAGTRNILARDVLDIPSLGTLNCHPGLLPQYRGCTCLEWAVLNGDPVGATCHFMSEAVDQGPIVLSAPMPVAAGSPYEKIRADMIDHACRTLADGVQAALREGRPASHYPMPGEGRYWKVMPEDKISEVRRKLLAGEYDTCSLRPARVGAAT